MVGLREVPRTAAFAWSPGPAPPFLATGTKAGAVDEGFSNDTQLELWDLDLSSSSSGKELQPAASIDTDSRFNDIAWTKEPDSDSRGIIAGALENGSLDLWDADKLLSGDSSSFLSRTQKHSGSIKALQFNAYRSGLLATVGAKGELFISDLSNVGNPFRMGNAVARADDFECLDWNKKSAHIMVTGSSGGTMTVWDIKNKRESLTLNNMGRKPVSAVAWDPNKATRLVTASPANTDPLILVWDLRNANAPERTLKAHDGGVLSLSWCQQDSDLLLSCGKDNRTICWNPQTEEAYGEFPVVTNWTFQTRWNPYNPSFMATASFDGKVLVNSIQNTNSEADRMAGAQAQPVDDDDFFNKAQTQLQGSTFTLAKAPKWLQRPCGATFGFGGKVVSFRTMGPDGGKRSMIRISTFTVDDSISDSTASFEAALKLNDLEGICTKRIAEAKTDGEKEDWKIIKTLTSDNTRKELVDYLGFSTKEDEAADGISKLSMNGNKPADEAGKSARDSAADKSNRLSAFFDNNTDGDNFLTELAAAKGAKTNNPFHMYSGTELESDRRITRSLLLGDFEKALDVCLSENRMSDAFMIAICGGQSCIDKAQKAYFSQKEGGPNYLRLLASVVGKNLWDLVHNADLASWKDVMATLCTYADSKEFPDLCEALGDRLEEKMQQEGAGSRSRQDATFCYLAGSKLEKVVSIWIAEMQEEENTDLNESKEGSAFSVHAQSLQNFIEKVTVFREVTSYRDDGQGSGDNWKLSSLYDKYIEYADITSTHGQLDIAERYLECLPSGYGAAEVAKNRIRQATRKVAPQTATKQQTPAKKSLGRGMPPLPDQQQQQPPLSQIVPPTGRGNPYAPPASAMSANPYAPAPGQQNMGPSYPQQPQQYQPSRPPMGMGAPQYGAPNQSNFGPPPRNMNPSPSIPPPSKAANMTNWNDTPEDFFKAPRSGRGTPAAVPPPPTSFQPAQPPTANSFAPPPRSTPPLAPPPRAPPGSTGPPPRITSPPTLAYQPSQPAERPPPMPTNAYAPSTSSLPVQPNQATIPRGPSPYNAPPSQPPPTNRYAPTQPPPNEPSSDPLARGSRQPPPPPPANPYAPQPGMGASPQQTSMPAFPPSQPSAPPTGPPSGPPGGPPQQQGSRPNTAQTQRKPSTPAPPKHRKTSVLHIIIERKPDTDLFSKSSRRSKSYPRFGATGLPNLERRHATGEGKSPGVV